MQIEIVDHLEQVAPRAANFIATEARQAITARGRFLFAVSGGRTPWQMLTELARHDLPWPRIHVFQVDERVAPLGDADRNLTHLRESLLNRVPLPEENLHAMPVELADLDAAAASYARTLQQFAGTPAILDLVHLGLGPDGHTASLIPGDAVLDLTDRDVAPTGIYQGRRRLTLTYPVLNRARLRFWLVTGAEKTAMIRRLRAADPTIPAGRVRLEDSWLLTENRGV